MDAQKPDPPTAPPRPELVRPWIWALLAAVLTLAVYLPALGGDFVWDDTQLIEQSPAPDTHKSVLSHFTTPFWEPNSITPQMSLYYRPLIALSYTLDSRVHGLNSAGYRITNYAFHTANVILLFVLIRRFGAPGAAAGLLSATWSILPRLSECVAWISGRTDVLATTALLAALLMWGKRWRNLALASATLFLGLLCKETALTGFIVLTYLECADGKWRARQFWQRAITLVLPVISWLLLKTSVSGLLPSGAEHQTASTRVLTTLEALGRYATMTLDWLHPSAEMGLMGSPHAGFVGVGIGVLTLIALVSARFWTRMTLSNRAFLLGAIGAILPVLHVVPLTLAVNAADRFLYIPLAFLVISASNATGLRLSRVRRLGLLIVLASSIPATVMRAKSWADPADLWTHEYANSNGTCQTCRIELAKLQAEAGDFGPALRIQQSLIRDTADAGGVPSLVAMNASILFMRMGDYDRAERLLSELIANQPMTPRFWLELAHVHLAKGEFAAAEESAKKALRLMPAYSGARGTIERIARLSQAESQLHDPKLSDARRAQLLSEAGRAKDAEPLWLRILRSAPEPAEIDGAISFMINAGSSAAVSEVLKSEALLSLASPPLVAKLRLKEGLHQRLLRANELARRHT